MLLNHRTIATNFSPVLRVFSFKPIPKYCNVWCEGNSSISQWSDTGPSWPSFLSSKSKFPLPLKIILAIALGHSLALSSGCIIYAV